MSENFYIDLHTHTTASDGTLSPKALVQRAGELGLRAIAITDHDTTDGVEEGLKAGEEYGVEVIPGVEISVSEEGTLLHILGYYIDPANADLSKVLGEIRELRNSRNQLMIQKLREIGFDISLDEVEALAGGNVVGRPHFAQLLVQKGYVSSTQEAFDKYIARGKPGHVKRTSLTPKDGIELILKAGGVPVLAHPKDLLLLNQTKYYPLFNQLKEYGLQGLEVYYSTHSDAEVKILKGIAEKLGFIITGGSDFHGDNKLEYQLGSGMGNLRIPYELVEGLKLSKSKLK